IRDLCEKYNYSPEHAEQLLFTQGWKINTTMEVKTQKILEDFFKNPANFNRGKETNKTQAYMTIMDLHGNTVAMVGGKGAKPGDRVLNRVTASKRPAGSTIKPLTIYTPAFDTNLINWSTMMDDNAVMQIDNGKGGKRPYPQNYDFKYQGNMTIIDAIRVSKNTIPVRLCNSLTPQNCFDFGYKKLGLKTLVPTGAHNNVNPGSMALGDGGTTIYDLTAAYQIFGNGGFYSAPKMYSQVVNGDGEIVLDTTNRASDRVMSSQTAYIMNKALWEVVNGGGSGGEAKMKNIEVVGKTGTSNDRRDLLFMGVTPYYVAGIRYGYDNNDVIKEKDDGLSQMVVWKNVMTKVLAGKKAAKFQLDDNGVEKREYC
ncbi:MAG: penicillin-binding transpeptidase domain-containing protein, partial [Oscillospiraceae bacterium]